MKQDPTQLMVTGRKWLRAQFTKNLAAKNPISLEAYKLAIGHGEIELGRLLSPGFQLLDLFALKRPVSVFIMRCRIYSESFITRLFVQFSWFAKYFFAILPALLLCFRDILRYKPAHNKDFVLDGSCFALYPEVSSRTRPLIEALKNYPQTLPIQILILGRPHLSVQNAEMLIQKQLNGRSVNVRYPFDRLDLAAALLELPKAILILIKHSTASAYLPTYRESAASIYRLILGLMSKNWSSRVGLKNKSILWMCHTGLCDTSMLELGLQQRNVKTVHWIHGISEGVNFSGLSDYAVFRCGHDLRWHADIGGYGTGLIGSKSIFPRQEIASRNNVFILLSNYAHLMNYGYQLNGIYDECCALKVFAAAANAVAAGMPLKLLWKPHPVFYTLPKSEQHALVNFAMDCGVEQVDQDLPFEKLFAQCKYFACTQSTVAIDLLVAGYTPVLIEIQATDPGYCLAQFSLKASDEASLVLAWNSLGLNSPDSSQVQADLLERIQPVSYSTIQELENKINYT